MIFVFLKKWCTKKIRSVWRSESPRNSNAKIVFPILENSNQNKEYSLENPWNQWKTYSVH
jgi:hypothetical protein